MKIILDIGFHKPYLISVELMIIKPLTTMIINETIAQQLNIKDFPFRIKDRQGNILYYEDSNGDWTKYECDSDGNIKYWENSRGEIGDNRPKLHDVITLNGIKYKRIDE